MVSLAVPARVSDPLTELLRTGARRLIEAAVTAEFEEYLSGLSIPSYFHKMANILLYSLCSASMAANSSSNGRNRSGGQLGICS